MRLYEIWKAVFQLTITYKRASRSTIYSKTDNVLSKLQTLSLSFNSHNGSSVFSADGEAGLREMKTLD